MSTQRNVTNKMIVSIAGIGFIILIVFWIIVGLVQHQKSQYEEILGSNWDVTKNGETLYENCEILDASFGKIDKGDELILSTILPEIANDGYTFEILLYLCSVEAYVDDELIYSYATDLIDDDVMIGSGYHFIPLPKNSGGKILRVVCKMNEDNAFTNVAEPRIAKTEYDRVYFARSKMIDMAIGMTLLGLGIVLSVVSLVAMFYNGVYRRLFFIGTFSLLMGSWTLQTNKVYELFSTELINGTNIEYMSLYFGPIPFALLIYEMRANDVTWRKKVVLAMDVLLIAFSSVATILHFTNILRYPVVLPFFHVCAFSCIVILAFAGYISVKDRTRSESVTAVAVLMLLGVLALDIGRFNLQKYVLPNFDLLMNSFVPLGTMAFVIMLLVSYLMYLYDMVMSKSERETLTRLAYHDVLTGLFNRAKYEQSLSELDESQEEFALISIDLNDLKYVNDTYGHNKGDLMLTSFAAILEKNFNAIGQCFRTGGDEYIVIIRAEHVDKMSAALERLADDEKEYSINQPFEIRASYGIAYRSEIDDNQAFKVFRLADRRMYEMKSQSKGKEYVFGQDSSSTAE